jgi:tRNA-2-methylthio-N6-dimethylallyladenosine synthase
LINDIREGLVLVECLRRFEGSNNAAVRVIMKAKILVETHGCQMNVSDSERTLSKLRESGYQVARSVDDADIVIINTCSVRAKAEQKVYSRVGEISLRKHKPLIGVMGCVAQLEGDKVFERSSQVSFVVGTGALNRIPQVINRALEGETKILDVGERSEDEAYETSHSELHSHYIAYVPIIEGCNKFCTYCIVPYSRGREQSRPAGDIIDEVLKLQSEGFSEVQLIGQNVNSYRPSTDRGLEKFGGSTSFSRLLRAVASTGIPRIKFTTSFPRDFQADIVKAIEENENLCNWVHLPVQSGNDRVLKAMRRGYTAADYMLRVESVLTSQRMISLTSDVIVGFPGEGEREFEDTMKLVEQCQFHGLYIFKYSQRKGTPAAKITDNVSSELVTDRFLRLEKLQRSIQNNIYENYRGKSVSVLVEGFSTRSSEDLTGHTTCNKVVNFNGGPDLIGKIVNVRISEAKANSLYGILN